jgi:hypothetical protein
MTAIAIRTSSGWSPLWALPLVTRETLQPHHQGWWMKDATTRRAFEDEQVERINATRLAKAGA